LANQLINIQTELSDFRHDGAFSQNPCPENRIHDAIQHGFSPILELTVAPAGAGKFAARLDGRELCVSTKPFLDAARDWAALRSPCAPLTVLEGDLRPRFAPWQAFERPAELPMAA
jgi:hypothetical protein